MYIDQAQAGPGLARPPVPAGWTPDSGRDSGCQVFCEHGVNLSEQFPSWQVEEVGRTMIIRCWKCFENSRPPGYWATVRYVAGPSSGAGASGTGGGGSGGDVSGGSSGSGGDSSGSGGGGGAGEEWFAWPGGPR